MKKSECYYHVLVASALMLVLFSCGIRAQTPTADEVIDQIKDNLTCDWSEETVDTYKGGHGAMRVTGIATTFLANMDVLKSAKEKGLNLIITHEPTFYDHRDNTDRYGDDPIVKAKQQYIEDNNLIVWRFHDHWHRTSPDGIYKGMTARLQFDQYSRDGSQIYYDLPTMTLKDLGLKLEKQFDQSTIRVVGDLEMEVSQVALVLGAAGANRQINSLQREDVEVVIVGEVPEWETVEYIRDATSLGRRKALIMLGHANSEEGGMEYCAEWLKTFINGVPIEFIPAGDPFWSPK
ncbi:MAG: Nif3-like dinuclear metal center hexameric protein [Cyclobacteriaceae bacterium]